MLEKPLGAPGCSDVDVRLLRFVGAEEVPAGRIEKEIGGRGSRGGKRDVMLALYSLTVRGDRVCTVDL